MTMSKASELWYWHISRSTSKFVPWVARKLPRKVKYYVVIHGMVSVEPNYNPSDVTGMQLLELWKEKW
jgi:hypothetical protein